MYEPYVKQLLETVKLRQAEASKYPDADFMFEDFKSAVEAAQKVLMRIPLKRQDIIEFFQQFLHAEHVHRQLVGLAGKHLTESDVSTLDQDLRSEIDSLITDIADEVDRLSMVFR